MEIINIFGKEVYKISALEQVKRFLSLGSDNGTYCVKSTDLLEMNIKSIDIVLNDEDERFKLLDIIKFYIDNNKCKKQETIVYLLAKCCSYEAHNKNTDILEFRTEAYSLLNIVCTIPTTLFLFIKYTKHIYNKIYNTNGWNNLHKRAINNWYSSKSDETLLYHITKYKDRNGYTHKDVLRLAHIKPDTIGKHDIYKYIIKGFDAVCNIMDDIDGDSNKLIGFIRDYECMKTATDSNIIVELINKRKFAREHIPTNMLNDPLVWEALLVNMGDIALLRNLNKLTICGLFDNYEIVTNVCDKIINIKKIHPIQLLIALKMYSSGCGCKGSNVWTPNQDIIDSLNDKFYELFKNVIPSGKRVCIGMDVSGSMYSNKAIGTECMSAAEISCALAMIMKYSDDRIDIMGFSNKFIPLNISPHRRLDDNLNTIKNLPFSSTDISLPFIWALDNNKEYDAFIVLTDNETNTNSIKPIDALKQYREKMNISSCKLIVVAMTANDISVADPNDKDMLDIAGFDASVPDIINEFINL